MRRVALSLLVSLAACSNSSPSNTDGHSVIAPATTAPTTAPTSLPTSVPARATPASTATPTPSTSTPSTSSSTPSQPTTSTPSTSTPSTSTPSTSTPSTTPSQPSTPTAPAPAKPPVVKPPVIWDPSPNHSSRGGTKIDAIVIHTLEGSYASGVSWLKDTSSKVSAHYVMKEDGEIKQLVADDRAAWAQTYYNSRGIGIECAGYSSKAATWTPALKKSLVELVAWLAKTYNVPVVHPTTNAYDFPNDKFIEKGLVAHGQIQPWNRSDPGPHFPWAQFVKDVEDRLK